MTTIDLSKLFATTERVADADASSEFFINKTRQEMLRLSSLSAEKRYIETHCADEMRTILRALNKDSVTELEFKAFLANLVRDFAKSI